MALQTKDIFTGSFVTISLNKDLTNSTPSYFDPGYISSENLAQFPSIGLSQAIQSIDDYRDDTTSKLAGDISIDQTSLVITETPDDEFLYDLNEALENKTKLRFRTLYVIDTDTGTNSPRNGVYSIYDAYVTKVQRQGGSNQVVSLTYTLEPEGQLFTGYVNVGEVLRQGDFGVGAGTEDFPGVTDLDSFQGNRWVTVDGSISSNPFSSDTAAMVLQHPTNVGWDMIASSSGAPMLRIRNKYLKGATPVASRWIKVYSESEKPTAVEVDAVSATNGGEFLAPVKFHCIQVMKDGSQVALIDHNGDSVFTSVTTPKGTITALESTTAKITTGNITTVNSTTGNITTVNSNAVNSVNGSIDTFKAKTIDTTDTITSAKRITAAEIYDGQVRVYSKNNQPTPADVGALSITGGTVTGNVQIDGKFVTQDITANSLKSSGNVSGLQILEGTIRVYSPNNKPTPAALGAVNKAGDTMTGDLTVPNISTQSVIVSTLSNDSAFNPLQLTGPQHTPLMLQRNGTNSSANINVGFRLSTGTYYLGINNTGDIAFGTNSNQSLNSKIYTESFRPTPADINAVAIGDSVSLGTF